MSVVLGRLEGKGVLLRKKEQPKKGRAKNVYIISIAPALFRQHRREIIEGLVKLGGKQYRFRDDSFVFTKIPVAEKAWIWYMLRWA